MKRRYRGSGEVGAFLLLFLMVAAVLGAILWGGPRYKVWSYAQSGEASLAEATYSRRIAVQEAQAKKDAAKMLAEAEIERAKGVAQANHIIGKSLQNNESYLRYLYITELGNSSGRETIYVPTEAGLPILEANRGARGTTPDK